MNLEEFRNFCLNLAHVSEGFPFDNKTLVFKVHGKMFALCDVDLFKSINLKCDPERAIALREEYQAVEPGYHMSKKHWNTVLLHADVDDNMLLELCKHSYDLVFASLPKKLRG
jgi:predicted DNA-binding protein (MmcQ/YjbR family)